PASTPRLGPQPAPGCPPTVATPLPPRSYAWLRTSTLAQLGETHRPWERPLRWQPFTQQNEQPQHRFVNSPPGIHAPGRKSVAKPRQPIKPPQPFRGFRRSWPAPAPSDQPARFHRSRASSGVMGKSARRGTALDGRAIGPLYGVSPAVVTSALVWVWSVRSLHALRGRRRAGPAVRLRLRAAPSAPLQHRPRPAAAPGAPRPEPARLRTGCPAAMGVGASVGNRTPEGPAVLQRPLRNGRQQARLPHPLPPAPLPHPGQQLLRMAEEGEGQAAVPVPHEGRAAVRL